MATAEDVAQWMVGDLWLRGKGVLEHRVAVERIRSKFGQRFVHENRIDPDVLAAFELMLPAEDVVYSFKNQLWRWRQPGDKPGRMQD